MSRIVKWIIHRHLRQLACRRCGRQEGGSLYADWLGRVTMVCERCRRTRIEQIIRVYLQYRSSQVSTSERLREDDE